MGAGPKRIAVAAEAFGFGPASKTAAVFAEIQNLGAAHGVAFADSIASEYLARQGIESPRPLHPSRPGEQAEIRRPADGLDGAIVALSPEWAEAFHALRVPTLFLDSLGFMWEP